MSLTSLSATPASVAVAAGSAYSRSSPANRTGLQAELQQLKRQLSDCVNCASASTPEGQKQIQALSQQIQAVQGKIEQPAPTATVSAAVSQDGAETAAGVTSPARPVSGGRIDLYA